MIHLQPLKTKQAVVTIQGLQLLKLWLSKYGIYVVVQRHEMNLS